MVLLGGPQDRQLTAWWAVLSTVHLSSLDASPETKAFSPWNQGLAATSAPRGVCPCLQSTWPQ